MIVIKLKGGLGNQMFQYAYGRNLELSGKSVVFDTSFFKKNKNKKDISRDFKLDKFNIQTKARFIEFANKEFFLLNLINKIRRRLGLGVEEYFQSEKYFINITETIKKEFVLREKPSLNTQNIFKKTKNVNSVSLHVRRGDYVTSKIANAYHGVCSMNYYQEAIKIIKNKVSNPVFFIFSDDIDWTIENFIGENFIFVSSKGIEDIEEVMLMSKCKHNIIANSSFSWWGAWLNNNPKKIIIAPKNWFKNKKINQVDIVPKDWIKI